MASVESLYSHLQKIYLKTKKGEEKCKTLRVTIETKSGLSISVGKVLSLQITDDIDCTFYYSLLLTQEDFSVLKCQQGLLVDFDHFPAQLIKLLEACKCQEFSKFILVLDEEDTDNQSNPFPQVTKDCVYLKVIETNNFKNLCHLSLKVLQGSDADIKNHMSMKIGQLTEKITEEEKKCKMTEVNLTEALKALEIKTREMTELTIKLTEEKNSLKLEASHQISEEREKLSKVQMEWQQKLECEKSQMAKQFQKQINDMNEQINLLTFNNKNLYEGKCQLETSVKEKTFHIDSLEKQIHQLTQEITLLRKQNNQLDQDYHAKDKALVSLKTKLAVMEQELKDKGKFQEKLQELLKAANDQKTFLEEALNEKEAHLQRKQSAVQTLSSDLMKSNEIIAKLKTDLVTTKTKINLRTGIALEQEIILEKKIEEMQKQTEVIKELEDKVGKLSEELNQTKTELEEAKKKVEEKDNVIRKNDNVINWLNRRLTECSSAPSTASNLISSGRSMNDSVFTTTQSKGSLSNLTKGWPPWLQNCITGNNPSRINSAAVTTGVNGITRLSNNTTPLDTPPDQMRNRVSLLNENNHPRIDEDSEMEPKIFTSETGPTKSRGLDPKYFQSSIDKDYITNPHVLKASNRKENRRTLSSASSSSSSTKVHKPDSRPVSGRPQPSSYFPKKL